jgi:hypothetical protein
MVSGRNNLVGQQSFFNAINHMIMATVNVGIHYDAIPFVVQREADEVLPAVCVVPLQHCDRSCRVGHEGESRGWFH